jgi:ABC-2 type transport system ATP-binding protein
MAPALDIEGLVKRYQTATEALKGVSLEIGAGEFFGLLGPNGAGKSTLIHCATGLAQPTAGDIRVFGHDACATTPRRGSRSGSRRRTSTSTGS